MSKHYFHCLNDPVNASGRYIHGDLVEYTLDQIDFCCLYSLLKTQFLIIFVVTFVKWVYFINLCAKI